MGPAHRRRAAAAAAAARGRTGQPRPDLDRTDRRHRRRARTRLDGASTSAGFRSSPHCLDVECRASAAAPGTSHRQGRLSFRRRRKPPARRLVRRGRTGRSRGTTACAQEEARRQEKAARGKSRGRTRGARPAVTGGFFGQRDRLQRARSWLRRRRHPHLSASHARSWICSAALAGQCRRRPAPTGRRSAQPETRVAAVEPAPPAAPTRKAAEAQPATGSGFLVQLSSFRSAADARKEYGRLSSLYPSVVGGLPEQIRETSVGGSTRYQLGLGPLPSRSDATRVCSALITAGESDCIVRGR
jgi:cell division protein FtsN